MNNCFAKTSKSYTKSYKFALRSFVSFYAGLDVFSKKMMQKKWRKRTRRWRLHFILLSFYLLECMVKPCALIHRSMMSQVKSNGHPIVKNLSWLVTPFAASNRPTSAFSRSPFPSFHPKTKLGNLALTLLVAKHSSFWANNFWHSFNCDSI